MERIGEGAEAEDHGHWWEKPVPSLQLTLSPNTELPLLVSEAVTVLELPELTSDLSTSWELLPWERRQARAGKRHSTSAWIPPWIPRGLLGFSLRI